MRQWDAWWGRYVAKRVCKANGSYMFEMRLVFGLQNRSKAVWDYASDIVVLSTLRTMKREVICVDQHVHQRLEKIEIHLSHLQESEHQRTPREKRMQSPHHGLRTEFQGKVDRSKRCNAIRRATFIKRFHPRFDCSRLLRARTQAPLHCPPKKVLQGWSIWYPSLRFRKSGTTHRGRYDIPLE